MKYIEILRAHDKHRINESTLVLQKKSDVLKMLDLFLEKWKSEDHNQQELSELLHALGYKVNFDGDRAEIMKEGSDPIDIVEIDIPLLIRMLEYAREDAKTDMDLHNVTDAMIKLSKSGVLTMDQYNEIVGELEEAKGDIRKGMAAIALIAGLWGVNNHFAQQAYDASPQLQKLTAYLEVAKDHNDQRMIDQLEQRIENHKARIDIGKGEVMGKDGKPADVVYDKNIGEEITCEGDEFYETFGDIEDSLEEAEYQGRKVKLNKPMRGDVKKFKVYVKDPKTGNVKKVNFGDPDMRIKKSNPKRRKSFRARHKCDQKKDRTTAGYWSCRKW